MMVAHNVITLVVSNQLTMIQLAKPVQPKELALMPTPGLLLLAQLNVTKLLTDMLLLPAKQHLILLVTILL